jgi:dTDP-4-amino-4,6-dideoxygalactose transaminase
VNVPLLDLKAQNAALADRLREAFERVMASGQFILGPELERFEQRAAGIAGTRHALGVSSGTDALLLALMALDIQPGDEVLCPSFTFFATAGSVARAGAAPVFADSCPACFNLDVTDARRRVTPRTRAIIPVHLFGQCADMQPVLELAREQGLRVIEDAAQAYGASYCGKPAGSMGDFGVYSFFPTKNLGAFGDAGLLATNDDPLAGKARLLRNHGAERRYFHQTIGGNFRMDALQAALLAVKLDHLEEYSAKRRENAAYYEKRLSRLPGVARASAADCPCRSGAPEPDWIGNGARILLPAAHSDNQHIWNQYTLRVLANARDGLRDHLAARGIGSEIYYPLPLHRQECFAGSGRALPVLPVAERLASECLSIPIYPELSREQQDYVVETIAGFLEASPFPAKPEKVSLR